jgi:hypothetical protein
MTTSERERLTRMLEACEMILARIKTQDPTSRALVDHAEETRRWVVERLERLPARSNERDPEPS